MKNDCEHRWTPQGNGISICELCQSTAFSDSAVDEWNIENWSRLVSEFSAESSINQ